MGAELERCDRFIFDSELFRLLRDPGFSYRIRPGYRCEGWLNGRLVLLLVNEMGKARHFHAKLDIPDARKSPDGWTYK